MKVIVANFKRYTADGLAHPSVLKAMGDCLTALSLRLDSKRLASALAVVC